MCDVCGKRINYKNRTDDNHILCDKCSNEELDYCNYCGSSTISYIVVNNLRCKNCENKDEN